MPIHYESIEHRRYDVKVVKRMLGPGRLSPRDKRSIVDYVERMDWVFREILRDNGLRLYKGAEPTFSASYPYVPELLPLKDASE